MKEIKVYTTNYCPYCVKAKTLLKSKNLEFVEIDVTENQEERLALVEKSGGRKTVPQIFIGTHHVGGYDDLAALDQEGKLEELAR
ncbi:MAG: glutaredoxin 3 [Alphaproteobacteria bacterium]|nr:glutaredoxin 3 [Alphaproteobacteria bacterium]